MSNDATSSPPARRPSEDGGDAIASPLRFGFSTGACATAASKAAATALFTGQWPDPVSIHLPKAPVALRDPSFPLIDPARGPGWARATVEKDAGDDPDVTHGALITVTIAHAAPGSGVTFHAGPGVGHVTKPGLPIPPGQPAINPVPRAMMTTVVSDVAAGAGARADIDLTVSIAGGEELAKRTWNPRLGIAGGLSVLGTTGVVRPFSCAAWIASIHRGVDVARAAGARHVIAATGATSEAAARDRIPLPDWAMLDMGDFAGGVLKYLAAHPIPRLTIAGGFAKLVKLSQGALDLHSKRSQVDFNALADRATGLEIDTRAIAQCGTALEALERAGPRLADRIAEDAARRAAAALGAAEIALDVMVVDRNGAVLAWRDRNGTDLHL